MLWHLLHNVFNFLNTILYKQVVQPFQKILFGLVKQLFFLDFSYFLLDKRIAAVCIVAYRQVKPMHFQLIFIVLDRKNKHRFFFFKQQAVIFNIPYKRLFLQIRQAVEHADPGMVFCNPILHGLIVPCRSIQSRRRTSLCLRFCS